MRFSPTHHLPSIVLIAAVAFLSACAGSGPATQTLDQRLVGVWSDEGGTLHTISTTSGGYAVRVVDTDQEVFNVVEVLWEDGVLSWTYVVPSTDYRVRHVTTQITLDRLDVRWDNQTGASGEDVLTRVE